MDGRKRIVRITTWIACLAAVAASLLPPLGYLAISYQYLAGSLDVEAEMTSQLITGLINSNPELWQYEELRLEELLARRVRGGHSETRRIMDAQGKLVAEVVSPQQPPLITRGYPLMDAGVFVGSVEISHSLLPLLGRCALIGLLGLLCGLGIFVVLRVLPLRAVAMAEKSLRQANASLQSEIHERKQAEEKISQHSAALQRKNLKLKALYQISAATSQSIELNQLLSHILQALAESEIFPFKIKGAIFLLEGEVLRLASFVSLTDTAMEPCGTVPLGVCLCGMAAATGEMIVSTNSLEDARHTRNNPGLAAHGHVIIPFKAIDQTCGVLNIFLQSPAEVDEQVLKLLLTIGNQVGIAVNNARLYEETKSIALHDPLTGLANRRAMAIHLEKSFDAAKRYAEQLSLLMLDIDHFKKYNDTHGHVAGDKLLINVAAVLQREIRGADLLFRYGGEEFLAILPHTDAPRACQLAERLRMTVESDTGITISLGVASCREEMNTKECLVTLADEALYRAKQTGRNRVESAGAMPRAVT